jgi:hypothetical protein
MTRGRLWGDRLRVLYQRIDEDDLFVATGADWRPLCPPLLETLERGTLRLVNAPGSGVADKALYAYVPRLIEYYLGESPVLANVPTYVCRDAGQRSEVLDRLAETRPRFGREYADGWPVADHQFPDGEPVGVQPAWVCGCLRRPPGATGVKLASLTLGEAKFHAFARWAVQLPSRAVSSRKRHFSRNATNARRGDRCRARTGRKRYLPWIFHHGGE